MGAQNLFRSYDTQKLPDVMRVKKLHHMNASSIVSEEAVMNESPKEITQLLAAWSQGEEGALAELLPLVYGELRRIAHGYLRRHAPGNTWQTTAVIHETYLRLVKQPERAWDGRKHFYALAAKIMRDILVDYARQREQLKRGGGAQAVELDEAAVIAVDRTAELVALDDVLQQLAQRDPRQCQVVELRYFGGLSVEETAEVLKVSPVTVARDWNMAKAWLQRELRKQ
jgi:RNA polymerase sigma factor (TIGR02999 family)